MNTPNHNTPPSPPESAKARFDQVQNELASVIELPRHTHSDQDLDALALHLLRSLDGLPVSTARDVLQRAEFWLLASTRLDCRATDFAAAEQAVGRDQETTP